MSSSNEDIKQKSLWVVKKCNLDLEKAGRGSWSYKSWTKLD